MIVIGLGGVTSLKSCALLGGEEKIRAAVNAKVRYNMIDIVLINYEQHCNGEVYERSMIAIDVTDQSRHVL